MKLLFICNQNQNRSKTAEELFKDKFETKSAGLYNQKPVTSKQLEWADLIVVMEDTHRREISERFPEQYLQKRILSLGIPDIFLHNDPDLIKLIKSKFNQVVKPFVK